MSKFFTRPVALLLALVCPALASEEMPPSSPPLPGLEVPESAASPGEGLPVVLNAGRFAALAKKSPFTLASTTEENADFAKDLILAGYFRTDGKDYVLVANRSHPTRLMVGTQPSPAAQGLVLVKVERDPSGDPTKLRAQIRKGTETATLKYEAAGEAAGLNQPAPVPGPAGLPGQPPAAQAAPAQAPAQNAPVIRRRVVPIPSVPAR